MKRDPILSLLKARLAPIPTAEEVKRFQELYHEHFGIWLNSDEALTRSIDCVQLVFLLDRIGLAVTPRANKYATASPPIANAPAHESCSLVMLTDIPEGV